MKKGFTLIELLVVVLIIGILAAIALPMYQKAVLRSRFAALMPIAKAMADSNEAYYLEHGQYASNPQELPVQGQLEYPTGTTLEFGSSIEYAYVLAHNQDARNNYIVYQKHSANYPGEIHCEALTGDELAESICAGFGNGEGIGTTLTDGYTTYVIDGIGAGISSGADDSTLSCDTAQANGLSCSITTNEQGQKVKMVCTGLVPNRICRTRTYNEDGGHTSITCKASAQDVCTSDLGLIIYDAAGHQLGTRYCSVVAGDGSCSEYDSSLDNTYDANGNLLTTRYCYGFVSGQIDSEGNCTSYEYGSDNAYDDEGRRTRSYSCNDGFNSDGSCNGYSFGEMYTYDAEGRQITMRECFRVNSNGSCAQYDYEDANGYDNTYDASGNVLIQRYCEAGDSNGNCTSYSRGYNYTYDENGNRLTYRQCQAMDSSGHCTSYRSGTDYTYDANGNQLTIRACTGVDVSGNCTSYRNGTDYTYDANGNKLTERSCNSVNSSGNCTSYSGGNDYTYDDEGRQTSALTCSSFASDGHCNTYSNASYRVYDDTGKQMVWQSCSGSNIYPSTGQCISYNSVNVQSN